MNYKSLALSIFYIGASSLNIYTSDSNSDTNLHDPVEAFNRLHIEARSTIQTLEDHVATLTDQNRKLLSTNSTLNTQLEELNTINARLKAQTADQKEELKTLAKVLDEKLQQINAANEQKIKAKTVHTQQIAALQEYADRLQKKRVQELDNQRRIYEQKISENLQKTEHGYQLLQKFYNQNTSDLQRYQMYHLPIAVIAAAGAGAAAGIVGTLFSQNYCAQQ